MTHSKCPSCPLYPCFDTSTGAIFSRDASGHIIFDCGHCKFAYDDLSSVSKLCSSVNIDSIDNIPKAFFLKSRICPKSSHKVRDTSDILNHLRKTQGLSQSMFVLSGNQKQEALKIEKRDKYQNLGIYSALSRDITIAIAHNASFRDPSIPVVILVKGRSIIGEMTSSGKMFYTADIDCDYVFPPVPFPELDQFGECIISSSPGYLLDSWLRDRMNLEPTDATLLIGLNALR